MVEMLVLAMLEARCCRSRLHPNRSSFLGQAHRIVLATPSGQCRWMINLSTSRIQLPEFRHLANTSSLRQSFRIAPANRLGHLPLVVLARALKDIFQELFHQHLACTLTISLLTTITESLTDRATGQRDYGTVLQEHQLLPSRVTPVKILKMILLVCLLVIRRNLTVTSSQITSSRPHM